MLEIFKTHVNGELKKTEEFEKGCWINLFAPTVEEIHRVERDLGILPNFIRDPLDDEEKPHIDDEDNQTLIVVDIPYVYEEDGAPIYETMPMGIIVTDDYVITVSFRKNDIIEAIKRNRIKDFSTHMHTRFAYQLLFVASKEFLRYLRLIDKKSYEAERTLRKAMRNKELFMLLQLEKSLVFFTTSLKSNEMVMERLLRGKGLKKYEEDQDLLEDVIIENKQAIEMANIYSSILSGMMDAYASVISNNLNMVMKFLASVTIVLSIPTLIAAFWGMNVGVPWQGNIMGFVFVGAISMVTTGIAFLWLWKRDMF
jgi:magnesium transporter